MTKPSKFSQPQDTETRGSLSALLVADVRAGKGDEAQS